MAVARYADSYSGLRGTPETSGSTVMQLLGMLMQQKQNQDALALREKEFQAQQGQQDISNEFTRGRFLAENADRDLRAQQINAQLEEARTRTGAGERSTALRGALELANAGADVDTSMLPPNERAIVESAKANAQEEIGRQYQTAAQAADAVNKHLRAQALVKSLKDSTDQGAANENASIIKPWTWGRSLIGRDGWWSGGDSPALESDKTQLKSLSDQLPDLSARASAVLADPNLKQAITFDPTSGQYVPIVPKPRLRGVPAMSGSGPVGPTDVPPAFQDAMGSASIPFTAPNTAVPQGDNTFVGRAAARAQRTAPRIVRQGNNVFQLMPDGSYKFLQRTDGYKDGGTVHGRGTSTSDNITAKVSPGEFIMPAEAMEIPGAPEAMNHMRQTALAIRARRGGRPPMMMPGHYAWGGMVDDAMGSMGDMGGTAASAMGSSGGGFNWLGLVMSFLKAKNANQQKPNPIYNWDGVA